MLSYFNKNRLIVLGLAVVVAIFVATFLLVGPPQILAKSDSPGFCAGCHVMES